MKIFDFSKGKRGPVRKPSPEIWWLSSKRMTILVETQDRLIVKAAPIVRKFIGQPLNNLTNWMRKQGAFKIHKYKD